jgi:SSS family solute:Na+ symporter
LFLINIAIMLFIGKWAPRKEAYVQQYTRQVEITNWKYVKPLGLVVVLVVISTYFIFV